MSTAEIVGIVAAVIVVLVILAVLLARGRGGRRASDERGEGSMFDQPPSDTLEKLGKPEHRTETPDRAGPEGPEAAGPEDLEPAAFEPAAGAAEGEPEVSPAQSARTAETAESVETVEPDETAEPAAEPHETAEPAVEGAMAAEPAGAEQVEESPAEVARAAEEAGAEEDVAQGDLVPLSSIIVTTSNKIVDLNDPEIRRMLTDLVTFEIDQASQFKEQGQTIDAVLQLTEAEKICRALGKEDTAHEIRAMMRELQA